uniref:Uncharacterized protein n=1 Tax=Amphimedon queenslandica TaxID=400682 RepID=A0A1X7TUB7_AMPQE
MYYRGSADAVVVYDITNLKSFIEMQSWIQELRQLRPLNFSSYIWIVAGNKLDISESRQCSAKDVTNVKDHFSRIADTIPLDKLNIDLKLSTVKLNRKSGHSSSGCSC